MTSQVDDYSVYPPDATDPDSVLLGSALLLPLEVYWCVRSFRRASVRAWDARNRVLWLLGLSWAILVADSLCLMLYSWLYLRCPLPYMYLRPPIANGQCLAMAFYAATQFTSPLAGGIFLVNSISRFLRTTRALRRDTMHRFIRVASALVAAALAIKLVASALLIPVANARATGSSDYGSTPVWEQFHNYAQVPFYGTLAALDLILVFIGLRHIRKAFNRERLQRTLNRGSVANLAPGAEWLEIRERVLNVLGVLMLVLNAANLVAFVVLFVGSFMHGQVPSIVIAFVYSALMRLFGTCQMAAIEFVAKAIRCDRKRNQAKSTTALGGSKQYMLQAAEVSKDDGQFSVSLLSNDEAIDEGPPI